VGGDRAQRGEGLEAISGRGQQHRGRASTSNACRGTSGMHQLRSGKKKLVRGPAQKKERKNGLGLRKQCNFLFTLIFKLIEISNGST
jgi:hypothetical protein